MERSEAEELLEVLRRKKNIILQGPPGTGKTFIAKRLAYAAMGDKDKASTGDGSVPSVLQLRGFHPGVPAGYRRAI